MNRISLDGNDWKMKEFVGMDWVWRDSVMPDTADTRWWYPASVPGSVMADLVRNGRVPDPYYEMNSRLVEWVPARTWVYRKEFLLEERIADRDYTLCFEGIDYSSELFLNGVSLGKQEGMYIPWKKNVTDLLHFGAENLLAVVIEPAPFEQPQVGRTSLVRTHKSRMTYWWDFCPRMIHQGIWQSVWLEETAGAVFEDVHVTAQLEENGSRAGVRIEMDVKVNRAGTWRLQGSFGNTVFAGNVQAGRNTFVCRIDEPKLWWPNGCGEAYEYPVELRLENALGYCSDMRSFAYGIREIAFECNEGITDPAGAFLLRVNGRRVYMNGYNWVPADVLYGAVTQERIRHLIRLAKDAGVNIFRVWGGGLIETELFYRECAAAGILIWQEFILSSSGIDNRTPADETYRRLLTDQAGSIVKRKRNHTALAVWCGGNELQDDAGMPLDNSDPLLAALKETVEGLDPGRKWLPTSPSGGLFLNSFENLEKAPERLYDVHGPWEHQGLGRHCELYNRGTSLLSTEFGVEGMTNRSALLRCVAPDHQLPASKDNEIYFHRGAWWNNEPLVQETFAGMLDDVEKIRKASQYLQYEGLKYAVECNRRRAFRNSGSFPWQFNEPYPNLYCTCAVDYYGVPKPVYYGMKKAYGSFRVTAAFESPSLSGREQLEAELYAGGDVTGEPYDGTVEAVLYDSMGKEVLRRSFQTCIADGIETSAGRLCVPLHLFTGELILLRLSLKTDGRVLSENEYLFTRTKDLSAVFASPHSGPKLCFCEDGIRVSNPEDQPLWFVYLTCESTDPAFHACKAGFYPEHNYFCLMPGEERLVGTADGILSGDQAFDLAADDPVPRQALTVQALNAPCRVWHDREFKCPQGVNGSECVSETEPYNGTDGTGKTV